jgi:uroporphyrinogen decarboxylase
MNDRFLKACRRQPVDATPVWLMRQAGRYMPEYRAVRERYSMLDVIKTPELACEVTLQPLSSFDLDAAIIFSDILPPLDALGLGLSFEKGEGPVIHRPLRSAADIAVLPPIEPRESLSYMLDGIRVTRQALENRVPLIGFVGAPFTLASYAIEGGSSRDFKLTKELMYGDAPGWHLLMDKLAALIGGYLVAQAEAGAQALQIFDSWAGTLSPFDFQEYVLPYVQRCVQAAKSTGVPVIYFGTDMSGMFPFLAQTGADVIGVDWRIQIDDARRLLGPDVAVQGNLDPHSLFAPWPEVERRAADVLRRNGGQVGHIFNLGHGILPGTPVENVRNLVDFVHEFSR